MFEHLQARTGGRIVPPPGVGKIKAGKARLLGHLRGGQRGAARVAGGANVAVGPDGGGGPFPTLPVVAAQSSGARAQNIAEQGAHAPPGRTTSDAQRPVGIALFDLQCRMGRVPDQPPDVTVRPTRCRKRAGEVTSGHIERYVGGVSHQSTHYDGVTGSGHTDRGGAITVLHGEGPVLWDLGGKSPGPNPQCINLAGGVDTEILDRPTRDAEEARILLAAADFHIADHVPASVVDAVKAAVVVPTDGGPVPVGRQVQIAHLQKVLPAGEVRGVVQML